MPKLDFNAIKPKDLHVNTYVASVQHWFDEAAAAGANLPALAVLGAFIEQLWGNEGFTEITLPHITTLLDHTLSMDSPRPGVIRFLLTEPE